MTVIAERRSFPSLLAVGPDDDEDSGVNDLAVEVEAVD